MSVPIHADRRSDGPVLLQARVASSRRWGRRSRTTVRVTSRSLHWGSGPGDDMSVEWTSVRAVDERDGALRVTWVDEAGREQVLVVELEGPVGWLVAEDVQRRATAARRTLATVRAA